MNIVPYMSDSEPDLNLKRKRDDIGSQNVKRYRALPEPSRKLIPAVRPRRQKPKRKFYQVKSSEPERQVAPIDKATPKAVELVGKSFQAEASTPERQVVPIDKAKPNAVELVGKSFQAEPPKPVLQAMDRDTKDTLKEATSVGSNDYKTSYEKCVAELMAQEESFISNRFQK